VSGERSASTDLRFVLGVAIIATWAAGGTFVLFSAEHRLGNIYAGLGWYGPRLIEEPDPPVVLAGLYDAARVARTDRLVEQIGNMVLFVPLVLGAAIALPSLRARAWVAIAFVASAATEAVQWLIGGRTAEPRDVLSNTGGTAVVAALVVTARAVGRRRRQARTSATDDDEIARTTALARAEGRRHPPAAPGSGPTG